MQKKHTRPVCGNRYGGKQMKKAALTVLFLLLCLMLPAGAVSETDGGIQYSVKDGEVTVEGFNFVGNTMSIPEKIDGMPVKYIAAQACRSNDAIVSLKIPGSVVSIGEFAFADCKNLTDVTFSGNTEIIGFSAFRNCAGLRNVTLSEGLKKIDDCAFYGCTLLKALAVPSSVTEIGVDVFNGCSALTLDVKNNALARDYAAKYSIPTDFRSSWGFTVAASAVGAAILGAAFFAFDRFVLKKRAKTKPSEKK